MPETQAALFDARQHERHQLTFLPKFGTDVRATCPCGAQFVGYSSDAVADQYNRHAGRGR